MAATGKILARGRWRAHADATCHFRDLIHRFHNRIDTAGAEAKRPQSLQICALSTKWASGGCDTSHSNRCMASELASHLRTLAHRSNGQTPKSPAILRCGGFSRVGTHLAHGCRCRRGGLGHPLPLLCNTHDTQHPSLWGLRIPQFRGSGVSRHGASGASTFDLPRRIAGRTAHHGPLPKRNTRANRNATQQGPVHRPGPVFFVRGAHAKLDGARRRERASVRESTRRRTCDRRSSYA